MEADLNFVPFELEHYQSLHEQNVEYNLADSSVKCLGVSDWLDETEKNQLLDTGLFYPEVNGTKSLRSAIASLYNQASPSNILVTVGASQANNVLCHSLLKQGDRVVIMTPSYRQVWGLAKNIGCLVYDLVLHRDRDWTWDEAELNAVICEGTRMVSVVNPNNPTGTVLSQRDMEVLISACARVGAWLHADEVYHGTEHPGAEPALSFWGMYDKLICTNSLSKAYGLSGLRIGWAIAAPDAIERLWRHHEYTVIAAAAPSMTLAELALRPAKRAWLLDRQRRITQAGLAVLREWLEAQAGLFSAPPARATSIALVRFRLPPGVTSLGLAEAARLGGSVLVAPGAALGAEGHVRVTVGYEPAKVRAGLARLATAARSLLAVPAVDADADGDDDRGPGS